MKTTEEIKNVSFPWVDDKNLKLAICDLINFYYQIDGNAAGGNLHVVLDDGNLGDEEIWSYQCECFENGDWVGLLILNVLRGFTEDEREEMFEKYWGM